MSVLPSHHGTVACSAGGKKLGTGYNGEDSVLAHELTVGNDDGDECGGGGKGKDVDGVGGQVLGNIDPSHVTAQLAGSNSFKEVFRT